MLAFSSELHSTLKMIQKKVFIYKWELSLETIRFHKVRWNCLLCDFYIVGNEHDEPVSSLETICTSHSANTIGDRGRIAGFINL